MKKLTIFLTLFLVVLLPEIAYSIDTPSLSDTLIAQQYLDKADSCNHEAEFESAVKYYGMAADIYLSLKYWKKYTHSQIWKTYMLIDLSRYEEAIQTMNESISEANKYFPPNNMYAFNCKVKRAIVYYILSQYVKNIQDLKEAVDLFMTNDARDSKLGLGVLASAYAEWGNNYLEIGKLDSAIIMFKKTLDIRNDIYEPNHELIVDCYNNLGIVYVYYGDYALAETYMLKALQGREANLGFAHPQTAWSYTNLAILNLDMGKYEIALDYALKGLKSRKEYLPPDHIDLASSYATIANIYNELNDFDKTLEYNQLAVDIYKKTGNILMLAGTYNNIADNYNDQGKYNEALHYFKKAYGMVIQNADADFLPQKMQYEFNIGDAFLMLNQLDSALYYNGLAYYSNLSQSIVDGNFETLQDFNMGLIVMGQQAELCYRKYLQSNSLHDLSLVYECCSRYMLYRDYFLNKAESKIEQKQQNSGIMNLAVNSAYTLSQRDPERYSSQLTGALIEKNKAGILTEMINKVSDTDQLPDSLTQQWKELTGDIYKLKAERDIRLSYDPSADITEITDSLFILQSNLYSVNNRIRENYPDYYGTMTSDVFSADEVISSLDDRTVILNYFVTDSMLFIDCIDNERELLVAQPIDSCFHDQVKAYLACLRKNRVQSFGEISNELYSILIDPVDSVIRNKSKLVIIPDKELYYFPFATLTKDTVAGEFENLNYLVTNYDIVYHYSATLYLRYLEESREKLPNEYSFLGMAPVFSDQGHAVNFNKESFSELYSTNDQVGEELLRSVSLDGISYNSLPYSEQEVDEIAEHFKDDGFRATTFSYGEANKSNFIKSCGNYNIVHLSSHGIINEVNPMLSGILFYPAPDTTNGGDFYSNSLLTTADIYNLKLHADLVVLSACETGLGAMVNGEGVLSMTRALTYAGAENIMYSLWKIGDRNTYKLMTRFYEYILNGDSFSEALRKTQIDMIKNRETAFPGVWGAFSLLSI